MRVEGADFGRPAYIQRHHQPVAGDAGGDDAGAFRQDRGGVGARQRFPRCGKGGSRWRSARPLPPAPWSGPQSASSAAPARTRRPARGSVRAQQFRSCKTLLGQQGSSLEQSSSSNSGQRLEVTVAGDEGSSRLDRVLAVRLPELSRSRLKALILAGSVSDRKRPRPRPRLSCRAGRYDHNRRAGSRRRRARRRGYRARYRL